MIVKHTLNILLLLTPTLLMSCTSQIPVATNYPYTEQQKMQAAHHWEVLATDVVEQLEQSNKISKTTPMIVVPEFYLPRLRTIPFKKAYQNFLITRLVDAGYNVVEPSGKAELLMTFDIQLVRHNDRPVRSPNIVSQIGRLLAGSADGAYVGIEASKYEVVITTSVKNKHTYVMSHTGTYYINTPAWDSNYALQGKIMEVVNQ